MVNFFSPFSRSLCSVVLSGPNNLCVMWLRVRKDDSACEWRESSNGQKKENENEEKKLCKLFWKIHYTIYTMSMRVQTQNEEMAKRERMRTREWGTLIYRFFIMWELHFFFTFHLFLSSLHFTFTLCVLIASVSTSSIIILQMKISIFTIPLLFLPIVSTQAQSTLDKHVATLCTYWRMQKKKALSSRMKEVESRRFSSEMNNSWHTEVRYKNLIIKVWIFWS